MPHDVRKGNIVLFHERAHKIPRVFHGIRRKIILFALFPAAKLDAEAVRVAAVRVKIDTARAAVPCDIRVADRLPDLVFVHKIVFVESASAWTAFKQGLQKKEEPDMTEAEVKKIIESTRRTYNSVSAVPAHRTISSCLL